MTKVHILEPIEDNIWWEGNDIHIRTTSGVMVGKNAYIRSIQYNFPGFEQDSTDSVTIITNDKRWESEPKE